MLGLKLNHVSKRGHRGVPGFATGSPCGVWGRGWTTFLHIGVFGFQKNNSWYVILVWWRGINSHFLLIYLLSECVSLSPTFCLLFFLSIFLLWNSVLYKVLCAIIFHRRSLDSLITMCSNKVALCLSCRHSHGYATTYRIVLGIITLPFLILNGDSANSSCNIRLNKKNGSGLCLRLMTYQLHSEWHIKPKPENKQRCNVNHTGFFNFSLKFVSKETIEQGWL